VTELTHVVEALLFVAAEPLTVEELAEAAGAAPERVERALDGLSARHCEGRSGVAGSYTHIRAHETLKKRGIRRRGA
jgi:chromosome segregation and condensation protein ScpB